MINPNLPRWATRIGVPPGFDVERSAYYLSSFEVAELLGLNRRQVHRLRKKDLLPAYRFGRDWLFYAGGVMWYNPAITKGQIVSYVRTRYETGWRLLSPGHWEGVPNE